MSFSQSVFDKKEEFYKRKVLDENMSKTGFKSFFNRDIKTSMEAFESLYLQWELKMVDEGFVENY